MKTHLTELTADKSFAHLYKERILHRYILYYYFWELRLKDNHLSATEQSTLLCRDAVVYTHAWKTIMHLYVCNDWAFGVKKLAVYTGVLSLVACTGCWDTYGNRVRTGPHMELRFLSDDERSSAFRWRWSLAKVFANDTSVPAEIYVGAILLCLLSYALICKCVFHTVSRLVWCLYS